MGLQRLPLCERRIVTFKRAVRLEVAHDRRIHCANVSRESTSVGL